MQTTGYIAANILAAAPQAVAEGIGKLLLLLAAAVVALILIGVSKLRK